MSGYKESNAEIQNLDNVDPKELGVGVRNQEGLRGCILGETMCYLVRIDAFMIGR